MLAALLVAAYAVGDDPTAQFRREVAPVLAKRCLPCHSAGNAKGGLSLADGAAARKGGDSGTALAPGRPDDSLLIQQVAGPKPAMPKGGAKLAPAEVAALRTWIANGAAWPADVALRPPADADWWSLRPVARPPLPAPTAGQSGSRHPVDLFLDEARARHGLKPSPPAPRATLIRRATFDLLGLPPTPEEIDAFVGDPREEAAAYAALLDRLLASPHYGERWARHWLDLAGYAESHGYDKDQPRANAWPYRDYVVRAFNEDKPYARFVREQVAGDAAHPETRDGVEALGFLAAGPWDLIGHAEVPETKVDGRIARHLDRDDMVARTMQTFVGMTVQCAQCHAHKFDPVSQDDYYSLQAVFAAVDKADRTYETDPRDGLRRAAAHAAVARLEAERQALAAAIRSPAVTRLRGELDDAVLADLPPESRGRWQALAEELKAARAGLAALPPPARCYVAAVHAGSGAFRGRGHDGGAPRPISVLERGNVQKPLRPAGPGALSAVTAIPARLAESAPDERRRRLWLAAWLAHRDQPLAWRVIVNRVWRWHFGRGIVETPSDFGRNGDLPTHPALLDWLAAEFRDADGNRQSLKALHRLLMTNAAYRQSAEPDPATAAAFASDPDNRWLWRFRRRRLEAEALRDGILMVAGKLDRRLGGPSFRDFVVQKPEHSPHYEYQLSDPDDPATHRRSIYRFVVRSQPQPLLAALGCADPAQSVDRRHEGSAPAAALGLLNNGFVAAMSKQAARKFGAVPGGLELQIDRAARECLGRPPADAERPAFAAFVREHGFANFARLLFNLNEFAFVD